MSKNTNEMTANNETVENENNTVETANVIASTTENPTVTGEGAGDDTETTVETVVAFKPRGTNKFAINATRDSQTLANKAQGIEAVRKFLRETSALATREGEAGTKALEPANKAAMELFNLLASSAISNDEVTDLLGSEFGYKVKKDGKPSKTPAGYGEEIRKRVQRLFKAYDYAVNGNEPVAFFEPLERDDVAAFVNEVRNGKRTPFAFYKAIGEFKSEHMGTRPKAAFDPRRIATLTRDILANIQSTVSAVQATPGLEAAYTGLWRALSIVGQELPQEEEQAA